MLLVHPKLCCHYVQWPSNHSSVVYDVCQVRLNLIVFFCSIRYDLIETKQICYSRWHIALYKENYVESLFSFLVKN